jgi:hypothetical protein
LVASLQDTLETMDECSNAPQVGLKLPAPTFNCTIISTLSKALLLVGLQAVLQPVDGEGALEERQLFGQPRPPAHYHAMNRVGRVEDQPLKG